MKLRTIKINCPACGEELDAEVVSQHADTERMEFADGHSIVVRIGVSLHAFVAHTCGASNEN